MERERPVVTVLGASGFVGSAVVAALAARPVTVRAVARRACPARDGVEVRTADLTDPDQVRAVVAGSDAVVHLLLPSAGWRAEGAESERVNVGVMRDLIACVRADRRRPVVLFAGSVSQAGPTPGLPIDGSEPDRPDSVYDRQKQTAESLLKAATRAGDLRGISLRLSTVYGCVAGERCADRGVLATMTRKALVGEPLTVWDGGAMERDLIHVTDVAEAFAAALAHPDALSGRHWVIGTGRGERLRDAFAAVAASVATRTGRPPVPVVTVPAPAAASSTDLRGVVVDPSAFAAATGWRARVPFRAGLDAAVTALARDAY